MGLNSKSKAMKNPNKILKIVLFSLLTPVFANNIIAQDKASIIKQAVKDSKFIFHAQVAMPASGGSRQLSSDYDLKISKNSLVSYLPFFGRAYSVPYGTTDGGLSFTSSKFDYAIKNRKKGGWEISIEPKDVPEFREFLLTVSESGYGTLQAVSNNRQLISFSGYITPAE